MKLNNTLAISTLALSIFAGLSTTASATDEGISANVRPVQFYLGSRIGASILSLSEECHDYYDSENCSIDDESVLSINPFVGISIPFSNRLGTRIELEGFYHSDADFKYNSYLDYQKIRTTATVKTSGGYINGYLDIYANRFFTPYFGFGLGVAHNKAELKFSDSAFNSSEDNNNFSYHIDVGTAINLNQHFAFDVGMRYADYGTVVKNVYTDDIKLDSLDLYAGVRVSF